MLVKLWLTVILANPTLSACGHHDYPPWNWAVDGKIIGVCAEVVSTLYKRMGLDVDLSYVGPWARCQQKVASGEVDINICTLRNHDREKYSRFSKTPMAFNDIALFVNSSIAHSIQQEKDLVGKRGAMMIGVSLGSEMDDFLSDHTSINRVNSLKQTFGLLLVNRVDFVPYGRSSGLLYLQKEKLNNNIVDLPWALQRSRLYIAVSSKSPYLYTISLLEPMLQEPGMVQWIDKLIYKYSELYREQQKHLKP